MPHTNETLNYKLPQFADTDQPTWLGDFNGAMNSIDTAIASVGANVSTALSAANNAVNRVDRVETAMADVQTTANNAYSLSATNEKKIGTLDGQVSQLETQLETKFPLTSESLANGAVTAPKLDRTAIAAMWAGLTVRRFDSAHSDADNEGMKVPTDGSMHGFYIEELGLLVINGMQNTYSDAPSALFTLPSYVPNNAVTGVVADAAVIVWNNTDNFKTWTSLYATGSTRQLALQTNPSAGDTFSLMGSVVLYMGANAGVSLNTRNAYRVMNATVD
jgi:hypothetical protein